MTIAVLSEFIGRLAAPVSVLTGSTLPASQLELLARVLLPFAHFDLLAFNDFLTKAEYYQKTGEVPQEPAHLAGIRKAVETLSGLMQTLHDIKAVPLAQEELARQLVQLGTSFGVSVSKPKIDAGWITTRQRLQDAQPILSRFHKLTERIKSNEPISSESMQEEIRQLSAVDESHLLVIAGELGVSIGTKAKPIREKQLVMGILSDLSGKPLVDQPKRASRVTKPKLSATPERVAEVTKELTDLIARTADPESVSNTEIEQFIGKLDKGGFSTDQLAELVYGVNGTRPKVKKKQLQAIRTKLNENRIGNDSEKQ